MKMTSRIALAAAAGALLGFASPAKAADLGGGCCADLEERVAELEATTARKGNRVVSLQVYGFVSRGILAYDSTVADEEDDVELRDDGPSRFGIRGSASLKPGWNAGYVMEFNTGGEQGDDVKIRQNNLWIESEQLGRVTVGQAWVASDGLGEIVLANISMGGPGGEIGSGFLDSALDIFEYDRGDIIRYDSPSIAGFIVSASWSDSLSGDDDDEYWDVALRYSGEFNAFRIAAGIGYLEREEAGPGFADEEALFGSVSVMHVPTGLFAAFSAGEREFDSAAADEDYWHVTGGIQKTWLPYGATTLFAEYGEYDNDDTIGTADVWGLGFNQKFDSAALDIFGLYRNIEDEGDEEDYFFLGAKINF